LPPAAIERHRGCVVCGAPTDNPHGLGLAFSPDGAGGVTATFRPAPHHRGWNDRLHGGLIATLLDGAMTHALFEQGIAAVTVELNVRFVAPAPLGHALEVSATTTGSRHGVHTATGRLVDGDRLIARATAKFMNL
jgi:uncharacterized protein (TIGR00369 family)